MSCALKAYRRSDFRIKMLRKRYWFPKKWEWDKKESLGVSRVGLTLVLAPTEERYRKNDLVLHTSKIQSRIQGVAGAAASATLQDPKFNLLLDSVRGVRNIYGPKVGTVISQSRASPPIQPWRMTICWTITWIDKSKLRIPAAEKANLNPTCLD